MSKYIEIGNRLRDFGKKNFLSMSAFARAIEMRPQTLNNYLSGEQRPGGILHQRLRALGCDIEWLMTGKSNDDFVPREIELAAIPVFDYIRAGTKTMILRDEPTEKYYIEKTTDNTRYGIIVRGDSMSPTVLEGNIVIATKIIEPRNGDLCVVEFEDGEKVLRRVYFHDHSCTLTSDNPHYPPVTHKKSEIKHLHRIMEKITRY